MVDAVEHVGASELAPTDLMEIQTPDDCHFSNKVTKLNENGLLSVYGRYSIPYVMGKILENG